MNIKQETSKQKRTMTWQYIHLKVDTNKKSIGTVHNTNISSHWNRKESLCSQTDIWKGKGNVRILKTKVFSWIIIIYNFNTNYMNQKKRGQNWHLLILISMLVIIVCNPMKIRIVFVTLEWDFHISWHGECQWSSSTERPCCTAMFLQ